MRSADSAEFQTTAEWRSWLDSGKAFPVFQPILSVESQSVYGYESFGRLGLPGCFESLGPFFRTRADDDLTQLKKDIGGLLARQAVRSAPQLGDARLFFNATPSLLSCHVGHDQSLPFPLQTLVEEGFSPSRVVIEVAEEPFYEDFFGLKRVLDECRELGCSIALDDVGSDASHLDRVALLHPDFIKVNLMLFQRSFRDRHFRRALSSLSRMADNLGASLLLEGIETADELQQALHFGARYVQGHYFSPPVPEPVPAGLYTPLLREAIENFCLIRSKRVQRQVAWENEMLLRLVDVSFAMHEVDGVVHISTEDLEGLSGFVRRLYFTDANGFQISPDYVITDEGCTTDSSELGRNLCLRPFFFDHVYKLHGRPGGWSLSDVYLDNSTKCLMRTFSRHVTQRAILFLDVVWANFADL